jgi:hypothetical protein
VSKVTWTDSGGREVTYRSSEYRVAVTGPRGKGQRKLHTFGSYTSGEWFRFSARSARQGRQPERRTGTLRETLPEGTVPLSDDCRPPKQALVMILDALRSDGRHTVELRDIETVVSQMGWELRQFSALPDATRRHAESALYKGILKRCTYDRLVD